MNQVVRDCAIELEGHTFLIDLIPYDLGSFDVVVGMDWMKAVGAVIDCADKAVCIPVGKKKVIKVYGEKSESWEKKVYSVGVEKIELKTVPVVRDFPDVFPEDLPGLPPSRQMDFRIDLVPNATPVAKSPYRLAPSEMQELAAQLQELQ